MAGMTCTYVVNSELKVLSINGDWEAFAQENDAAHLAADNVIGKPLDEFITDPRTLHLYRMMVQKALEVQRPLYVPFRCDAPDLRRYMSMRIVPLSQGRCRFESTVEREEPRDAVRLLNPHAERSDDILRICSWCKRVDVAKNDWREVEEAVKTLDLFDDHPLPNLTHTICDCCLEAATDALEAGD